MFQTWHGSINAFVCVSKPEYSSYNSEVKCWVGREGRVCGCTSLTGNQLGQSITLGHNHKVTLFVCFSLKKKKNTGLRENEQ